MQVIEEQQKRNDLQDVLRDLSKSQEVLKDRKVRRDFYIRLEGIYYNTDMDNFRHFYSDIFACLSLIDADSSLGNLDILAQNMQAIKDGYVPTNKDENGKLIDISKEIIKLYDHTNLDIGRINYTKRITGETQSQLANTQVLIDDLKQKFDKSEKASKASTEQLRQESEKLKTEVHDAQKKMQNEYITILGIFTSIVFAFVGGMTFSSSVLENIDKSSAYRTLAIVFILGIVLINLVWLLIDFLREINEKSIRKWWLIIVVNCILVAGLVLTFVAYKYQWLEIKEESIVQETLEEKENSNIEVPSNQSN